MSKKLRVKPHIGARPRLVRMVNGTLVNFGSERGFIREVSATTKRAAYEQVIIGHTDEHLKIVQGQGNNGFIEEYDPVEEEKIIKAKAEIRAKAEKEQKDFQDKQRKLAAEAKAAAAGTGTTGTVAKSNAVGDK